MTVLNKHHRSLTGLNIPNVVKGKVPLPGLEIGLAHWKVKTQALCYLLFSKFISPMQLRRHNQDGFAHGSAPVDQFQEFLHPAYGYGCGGSELRSDEGMAGAAGTPSWDVAIKPVANCKIYNNITIC
jgi:hypothetical protein